DPRVAAVDPTQFLQPLQERRQASFRFRMIGGRAHQYADAPYAIGLLRARRQRPRGSDAKKRNERAPLHSITSSARPSSVSGKVRPRLLAVVMLMAKSTFVDCCTGRSAGLSPLRMRPV